jgi:hypothetical protein
MENKKQINQLTDKQAQEVLCYAEGHWSDTVTFEWKRSEQRWKRSP